MILLLMALGTLAVAFWAFEPDARGSEQYGHAGPGEMVMEREMSEGMGPGISIEGIVLDISQTRSGGNLLLTLDSTDLPVFVSSRAGAAEIQEWLHQGDRVRIRGAVSEYLGEEELSVSRDSDIQLLSE